MILKKEAGEFDSKVGNTNPLFDSHLSERLGVIPGLVGGWLPNSCTATHSLGLISVLSSLCAQLHMCELTKTSLLIQLD